MRLSLCIATYNEEKNIHYSLDSAYDLVDEVIIVDGGSTDKTVEIAKSYGRKVKLFKEDNPQMFHINKQKAIERARGEWILQLDADEALSEELREEIRLKLEVGSKRNSKTSNFQPQTSNFVAFWIPRKNFFLTQFLMKGGQYPDYTIRLYRNGYARFPCKSVHENVVINSEFRVQNSESKNKKEILDSQFNSELSIHNSKLVGHLKNPILHYADPDFSRYLKRWDRYTSLEAEQLRNNKQLTINNLMMFDYFFVKPSVTFFSMYFRHLGFLDGFPGFVFALFSSIRFWAIYIKWYQKIQKGLELG